MSYLEPTNQSLSHKTAAWITYSEMKCTTHRPPHMIMKEKNLNTGHDCTATGRHLFKQK